jgi:hypothetical protein
VKFKTKLGAFLAALVAMLGGLAIVSAPAQAAATDCPAARICVWKGVQYDGARYDFAEYSFRNACFSIGGSFNDQVNSVRLNQPQGLGHVTFWSNSGCSGTLITIPVGNSFNNSIKDCLGVNGSWNVSCGVGRPNMISSARYVYP